MEKVNKYMIMKFTTLFFLVIICGGFIISQQPTSNIVGEWIEKEDPKSKWVFTQENSEVYSDKEVKLNSNKKLHVFYDNELIDTFTYNISRTSPKCGRDIEAERNARPELYFLELNDTDKGDQYCYYVFGLNEDNLSIKPFNGAEIIVFKRQQ